MFSALTETKAVVSPGAILAQNMEAAGIGEQRWRVESLADYCGVPHARLVSEDRLSRKTLSVGVLNAAHGWHSA